MEIKTEELIAKIKQAEIKWIAMEQQNQELQICICKKYQDDFYKLGDRINNLIRLGETLMESGFSLGEKYEIFGAVYEKLKTDNIHDNIGFMVYSGKIIGIGIEGSKCDAGNLCVGKGGLITIGMPKKYKFGDGYSKGESQKMQKLLDGFSDFEKAVVDYINSL